MKATTDELRAKIGEIEGRKVELTAERDEHAYAAHVERNAKAQKRLTEISAELLHLEHEKASLQAALAEAGRRAEAATAAEAAETERKRAEKAEPILSRLEARGAKLDAALKSYVENFNGLNADIEELTRLGIPVPTRNLVAVNLRNAHDAGMSIDKISRPVQPVKRRTFNELTRGWSLPGMNWVKSKLNMIAAQDAA
jgi:DNA repair exonuclease SbcCD ATPase subunit